VLIRFVENIGADTIRFISSFYEALSFFILSISYVFNPKNYNKELLENLTKQIYFTSVTTVPFFMFIAILFGSTIIGFVISFAAKYNILLQIDTIIITFVFNEFSAFFTILYVYLRLIKLQKLQNITPDINNTLPEILNAVMSTLMLSILFAIIMLLSGSIVSSFIIGIDFYTYKSLIFEAIELKNVLVLIIKSSLFGLVGVLIFYTIPLNLKKL